MSLTGPSPLTLRVIRCLAALASRLMQQIRRAVEASMQDLLQCAKELFGRPLIEPSS
jgi:hypothetical protein